MSNANGPDFVESTRAANDRKPTSATKKRDDCIFFAIVSF